MEVKNATYLYSIEQLHPSFTAFILQAFFLETGTDRGSYVEENWVSEHQTDNSLPD